jgi:hypothetical protein
MKNRKPTRPIPLKETSLDSHPLQGKVEDYFPSHHRSDAAAITKQSESGYSEALALN